MKRFKQKKWTALLLTFALLMTLFPSMAFASRSIATADTYSDWSSSTSLPSSSGSYRLTGDVTVSSQTMISSSSARIILDLNGNTVTYSGSSGYLYFVNNGSLTIEDSVGGGKMTNEGTTASSQSLVFINANGSFTMTGGTLESASNMGQALYLNGTGSMSGGEIRHTASNGYAVYVNSKGTFDFSNGIVENTVGSRTVYVNGIYRQTGGTVSAAGTSESFGAVYANVSAKELTVSGGKIESAGTAIYSIDSDVEVKVTSGTITAGTYAFQTKKATIGAQGTDGPSVEADTALFCGRHNPENTVLSGNFTSPKTAELKAGADSDETIKDVLTVNGGTFSENITGLAECAGEGLEVVTNPDGTFTVDIKRLDAIYVDGVSGDDTNSGADAENAVKTIDKAMGLVSADGVIYICGKVTINSETSISGVTIKRADGYLDQLISVDGSNAKLTLTNVTIDGNKIANTSSTGYLVFVSGGATLNVEEGTQLINNMATAVYVNVSSFMNMSGGAISGNTTKSTGGGGIDNCGTTVISGGEISSNSAGTNFTGGGILNERGTVTLTGTAEIKNNTATSGGGVAILGGAKTILGGASISGNQAIGGNGGGVLLQGWTNFDNTPDVLEMISGSITGNTSDGAGAGIFGYYYDGETTIRISGGTISGNTSTVEEIGHAIALYGINGSEAYAKLELSGSPTISGDVFFYNDYPDGYVINVTGEFNPTNPVAISRSNDKLSVIAVEYADGVTPKASDFTSDTIFEALVIDGQTMKWVEAGIIYFYADADKEEEYRDFRQGVAMGTKIDPANVPAPTKTGYTLAGWVNEDTEALWNFDTDTVEGALIYLIASWNLNTPTVSVTADALEAHVGSTVTLTAKASHVLDGVTYTYQWYKDGELLDGETNSTLSVSESGSYTVKVSASDGQIASAEAESAASEVTITGHSYVDTVTPPTCTEQGYTTHTCSICQDSYVDTYVDATGHSYGEWVETKPATETEKGEKQRTCSVCGDVETAEIPELGHTHNYGTEWKYNETSHWNECDCGEKANEASHTYEWVIDKEATATEAGSKHEKCTVCGYAKAAVEIPATGTDSSSSSSSSTTNPQTGDSGSLGMCIALLLTGICGLGCTVLFEKKRRA